MPLLDMQSDFTMIKLAAAIDSMAFSCAHLKNAEGNDF